MCGRTELPSGLVTFMFTDIEGSTRLARMLGDDYGTVLGAHRSLLRAALARFGGVELFTEGDSFFVAFRDASAAVAACVTAQRALSDHDWPGPDATPCVRMGLHTGWATPVAGEYASAEVHRAARVCAAAHGGQILCSEAAALAATTWSPAPGHPLGDGTGVASVDLLDLGLHRLRGFDDTERLFQVVAPELQREFPRPRTPAAPAHNLPAALTSFVGRRAEVAELTGLVGRHRLITIAGAGGAGKTRLAVAVAQELPAAYPQGIWLVDAAAGRPTATDPAAGRDDLAVVQAIDLAADIAAALGLRGEPGRPILESVVERCADRRLLLLVDTCDAAPAAVRAVVSRLLAACPHVDVLATGRQPLGVHGELIWRIPPLTPADAFALLQERAIATRGGRAAPAGQVGDLARVAARLDGLPLAIELAAARLQLLSPAQLASRLDDPLTALDAGREGAAGRHDSLAGSLDWSYGRLGDRASELLRRLAVFAGPVDLATVEWCGADALGGLSELADKSLVEVVPGPRYRMSEQVRAYAVRRLAAAGEERAARDRHVAWALNNLDGVTVDSEGQPRTVSLTEVAPYIAEWQAALRWAATGGSAHAGLRLAGALDPWWREYDGTRDGRDLLYRLYRRLDGEHIVPAELAAAYLVHAGLADDRDERERFLDRAEEIARRSGPPALLVRALAGRRITLLEQHRFAEAQWVCREVIARAERAGVQAAALPSVLALAELLWRDGAIDRAAELLGSARQLEAGRPQDRGRRTVDWLLGMVALCRGDLVAAHEHLVVALRSRLRHGFRGAAADSVAAIAVRCAMGGDPVSAAVLFGGAESVRGERRTKVFGTFWSAQQSGVRVALGDTAFDAAYADGAELGFDQIVAMALAVEHPDLEHGSARFAPTLR